MTKRRTTGRRIREDRISFLPNDLLCRIISNLCTKIALRTSALSKRWRSVWTSIHLLELSVSDFRGDNSLGRFVTFADGFLNNFSKSYLCKLKLDFVGREVVGDMSFLTRWIEYVITKKFRHLDINCCSSDLDMVMEILMPVRVYTCKSMEFLKLHFVSLPDFKYVSLLSLKILHLEVNAYANDALLENLISSCPVLEDLKIFRCAEVKHPIKVLRVRSQSLKSLMLDQRGAENWYSEEDTHGWEVVIDAPKLNHLSLEDDQSSSFVINDLNSSAKVYIDVNFGFHLSPVGIDSSKRSAVRNFLTKLSNVREMTLSGRTLKELQEFTKGEQLILPSSSVSKCLRSSMEYVEIKTPIHEVGEELKLSVKE